MSHPHPSATNEIDYTIDDFNNVASKLSYIHNSYILFLRQEGVLDAIEQRMDSGA